MNDALTQYQTRINQVLTSHIDALPNLEPRLKDAMRHGLLLGGKRIRPFLVYACGELFDANPQDLDIAAAAIECIHAYSLIHDDLPAMDDDELRRGQPTCHIAFDEATAILAGDALQTLAFDILASGSLSPQAAPHRVAMIQTLARASGYSGMCGGQALDLAATDQEVDIAQLERIHRNKTGALIQAACQLGALASGQNQTQILAHLDAYSSAVGLAFQVHDDVLDITADTHTLGKPSGSDQQANKSTYPALLGLPQAQALAQSLIEEALQALEALPYNSQTLAAFARFIIARSH